MTNDTQTNDGGVSYDRDVFARGAFTLYDGKGKQVLCPIQAAGFDGPSQSRVRLAKRFDREAHETLGAECFLDEADAKRVWRRMYDDIPDAPDFEGMKQLAKRVGEKLGWLDG